MSLYLSALQEDINIEQTIYISKGKLRFASKNKPKQKKSIRTSPRNRKHEGKI